MRQTSSPPRPAGAAILLRLAKVVEAHWGDFEAGLEQLTEAASEALDVDRAGIWFYDDAKSAIECADAFDRSTGTHSSGERLSARDHPSYFCALSNQRVVAAADAANDPRTAELVPTYLRSHQVTAMIDAPLRHRGELVGVICHEHVGGSRVWTDEECGLAGSLADFCALLLEARDHSRAEERLRAITNNVSDAIIELDECGDMTFVSPNGCELLGYARDDLLGRCLLEHVHPEDVDEARKALDEALRDRGELNLLYRYECGDGSWRWLETRGRFRESGTSGFVVVSRDVTARREADVETRRLEHQLFQAQKLEAIGRLAGGIAHDFNNLLTVVMGHVTIALEEPELSKDLHDDLTEVRTATERAASLTRQLLTLAARRESNAVRFGIDEAVGRLGRWVRRVIGVSIEVDLQLDAGPAEVLMEPERLDQLVMNLCLNARDAMTEGGRLTLSTSRVRLHGAPSEGFGDLPPGRYVELVVADTGTGMSEEVAQRIFEPFFSTKPVGEGTGLGLSMAYGVVRQAHGGIAVDTEPDAGTRFRIVIPEADPALAAAAVERRVRGREQGRSGLILLVEDEEPLRGLMRRVLEADGHRVEVAPDGEQALAIAETMRVPPDLLVSDVAMPGLDGISLAHELRRIRPELGVLLVSGCVSPESNEPLDLPPGAEFLAKPFSPQALSQLVRRMLAGTARVEDTAS